MIQRLNTLLPKNIPGFYQIAETQNLVILGAMSAGLPVVKIRSTGIDNVILEVQTDFKTLNDIETWNSKLKLLIEDKAS
ncbi:MAG: hypothetical protein RQ732_03095 [Methylophaga sp.]|nr:hypothetical protein [Methylophaga sp.]